MKTKQKKLPPTKTISELVNDLSKCCKAPVTTEGMGDFDDKDRVCTQYFVCGACKQPCDIIYPKQKKKSFEERQVSLNFKKSLVYLGVDGERFYREEDIKQSLKQKLAEEVKAAIKYGDLREGNLENCMEIIINKL